MKVKQGDKNEARQRDRPTLGLGEVTLLDAGLDGLVELAVKGGLGSRRDLVVGLHIFLDGLAAANGVSIEAS